VVCCSVLVFVGVYEKGECGEWEGETLGILVVRSACCADGVGNCFELADSLVDMKI
jgi:hypothetical protein